MFAFSRAPILPLPQWQHLITSLAWTIAFLNATRSVICGPHGEGLPVLNDDRVLFNGNLLGRHWWSARHPGRMIPGLENDDAHEDLVLDRCVPAPTTATRMAHLHLSTAGKPYTLGVRATLLLARHHFPDQTFIASAPGKRADWLAAWEVARGACPTLALPPECELDITLIDMEPRYLRIASRGHGL